MPEPKWALVNVMRHRKPPLGLGAPVNRITEEGELSSASGMAEACRQARNTAQVCSDGARAPRG